MAYLAKTCPKGTAPLRNALHTALAIKMHGHSHVSATLGAAEKVIGAYAEQPELRGLRPAPFIPITPTAMKNILLLLALMLAVSAVYCPRPGPCRRQPQLGRLQQRRRQNDRLAQQRLRREGRLQLHNVRGADISGLSRDSRSDFHAGLYGSLGSASSRRCKSSCCTPARALASAAPALRKTIV